MRWTLWTAALALAACRYHDLADAPIHGATAEQEAAIRAEMEAFDAAVGPGRTRIAGVWIEELPEGRAGQFLRARRRVELDPEDGLHRDTLVHELCHALDADEDLWKDPLMATLAEGFFDPDYADAPTDPAATRTQRSRQREAFASFCETGAVAAWAQRDRCPDDPPELEAIARFYSDRVYSAFDARPLEPGEVVAGAPAGIEDPRPASPPPGLIGVVDPDLFEGDAEGPFATRALFWLHHLGNSAPRFVAYDADGWATEQVPCALRGQRLVRADGTIWMQRTVGWQRLLP